MIPTRLTAPIVLGLRVAAILGALSAAATATPWPIGTWPVSSPGQQGLDPAPIDRLVDSIRQGQRYPDIHSLLIVRNGYLVTEEYFEDWGPDRVHTLQSVSKSITSALVGIALREGDFKSI